MAEFILTNVGTRSSREQKFGRHTHKCSSYILSTVKPVLNRTSLGPTLVFGIDRCSVYRG